MRADLLLPLHRQRCPPSQLACSPIGYNVASLPHCEASCLQRLPCSPDANLQVVQACEAAAGNGQPDSPAVGEGHRHLWILRCTKRARAFNTADIANSHERAIMGIRGGVGHWGVMH
jgi:hypothetical protein